MTCCIGLYQACQATPYERGPDGRQYAISGEVDIDLSKPAEPGEALKKALVVQRAALAPAQPSAQDRAVAAEAAQMATQARAELQQQKAEERRAADDIPDSTASSPVEQAYTAATSRTNHLKNCDQVLVCHKK